MNRKLSLLQCSGVGKSAFAVLLTAFLAHKQRPVLYRHKASEFETMLLMDFSKQPFAFRMAAYESVLQRKWEVSGIMDEHIGRKGMGLPPNSKTNLLMMFAL